MKKLFKIMAVAVSVAVAGFGFASCSSDDDEPGTLKNTVVCIPAGMTHPISFSLENEKTVNLEVKILTLDCDNIGIQVDFFDNENKKIDDLSTETISSKENNRVTIHEKSKTLSAGNYHIDITTPDTKWDNKKQKNGTNTDAVTVRATVSVEE